MKWVAIIFGGLFCYTLVMVGLFWKSPTESVDAPTLAETRDVDAVIETSGEGTEEPSGALPRLSSGGIRSLAQTVSMPAENRDDETGEAVSDGEAAVAKPTLAEAMDEAAIREREARSVDPKAVLRKAEAQRRAGEDRLALRTVERFLRHDRDHVEALLVKAAVLTDLGRYRDAVETYEAIEAIRDDDADVPFNMGVALTRLMRFGDATAAYRRAIELDPEHIQAKYNLAVIYQREGSLTAAIGLWRWINERSPALASAWFHRGAGHLDLEQWAEAADCFGHVTQLEPTAADGWTNLGIAMAKQSRFDEAIETLRRALRLEPEHLLALNTLAASHWGRYQSGEGTAEDKASAIQAARKSLELDRDQSGMRDLLDAMFDEVIDP